MNVESVCGEVRSIHDKSSQSRILFHYNGHGVPVPSDLGELWVFNKNFDKYKPVSISVIHVGLDRVVIFSPG